MNHVQLALKVNGEERLLSCPVQATLLEALRENLGLTGTKHGCELGECGACAVLVNGKALLSCLTLAVECEGAEITTIEGLAGDSSELHPLQAAFADLGGSQCGYCTPGMILAAADLLRRCPRPTREQAAQELSGNLCRCTGYHQILDAVERAAKEMAP